MSAWQTQFIQFVYPHGREVIFCYSLKNCDDQNSGLWREIFTTTFKHLRAKPKRTAWRQPNVNWTDTEISAPSKNRDLVSADKSDQIKIRLIARKKFRKGHVHDWNHWERMVPLLPDDNVSSWRTKTLGKWEGKRIFVVKLPSCRTLPFQCYYHGVIGAHSYGLWLRCQPKVKNNGTFLPKEVTAKY